MSEFEKILKKRSLQEHTGRPIWTYNIGDLEFNQLKENFKIAETIRQISSIDCAIYFAEWWKRNYNGGKYSKEEVYFSIDSSNLCFGATEFYDKAVEGGRRLGYKWITINNTWWLRTLLLQGGLPLNHIRNNTSQYRNFLFKIIALNPKSISDFSQIDDLIFLLPESSRNEVIYSSCLDIVRTILDNNTDELNLLRSNDDLKELTNDLIKERDKVLRKTNPIKIKWRLNPIKNIFYLNVSVNSDITCNELNFILGIHNTTEFNEYKLFINNEFVCKFIKLNNGNFRKQQFKKTTFEASPEFNPEVYFVDSNGERFVVSNLLEGNLDIERPSLWIKEDSDAYMLEKTRRTSAEMAGVLHSNSDKVIGDIIKSTELRIHNKTLIFSEFSGKISIESELDQAIFKTHSESEFVWNIISTVPAWMTKCNMYTVRDKLVIHVYDREGKLIRNPIIEWKGINEFKWNPLNNDVRLTPGAIDVKISYENGIEFDRVFNIGSMEFVSTLDINKPELQIVNSDFLAEVYESDSYAFDINLNKIKFGKKDDAKFPAGIKVRLSYLNQRLGLIAEIQSPFQGVLITDHNDNRIADDATIYLDKIKGCRLITNYSNKKFVVKIFNNKNQEIKLVKQLISKITPLSEFNDLFKSLFELFNVVDEENYLKLEVYTDNITKTRYQIKQFSEKVKWEPSQGGVRIKDVGKINIRDLYSIPLDCDCEKIDKLELLAVGDDFKIQSSPEIKKFILFSSKNAESKIKPEFISIDPENQETTDEDRHKRITLFKEELLEKDFSDDIWNKFQVYYYLCKENDLPFSTLDILKSITTSSKLAAKAFVFLSKNFDFVNAQFSTHDFITLENDLGFSFHWVHLNDWIEYFDSINSIATMLGTKWNHLNKCILKDDFQSNRNFGFIVESRNVRQRLGERVMQELPVYDGSNDNNQNMRAIPSEYTFNKSFDILVIAPLIVASSMQTGSEGLWHMNADNFRRKVKYVEQLDSKWFEEALVYFINEIRKRG